MSEDMRELRSVLETKDLIGDLKSSVTMWRGIAFVLGAAWVATCILAFGSRS